MRRALRLMEAVEAPEAGEASEPPSAGKRDRHGCSDAATADASVCRGSPTARKLKILLWSVGIVSFLAAFAWEKFDEPTVVDEHGFTANDLPGGGFHAKWVAAGRALEEQLRLRARAGATRRFGADTREAIPRPGFASTDAAERLVEAASTADLKAGKAAPPSKVISEENTCLLEPLVQLIEAPFCVEVPPLFATRASQYRPHYNCEEAAGNDGDSGAAQLRRYRFRATASAAGHWVAFAVAAERGDNRDTFAHVLAAPLAGLAKPPVAAAVAAFLSAARYLAGVPWNSRDVVFVIADNSLPFGAAVKDFLDAAAAGGTDGDASGGGSGGGGAGTSGSGTVAAYGNGFGSGSGEADASGVGLSGGRRFDFLHPAAYMFPAFGSGAIRGAIVYDFDSPWLFQRHLGGPAAVDDDSIFDGAVALLVSEGRSGMLPNQDAVNVFIRQADRSRLRVRVAGGWSHIAAMATVDAGAHSPHSLFLERNIPTFLVRLNARKIAAETRHGALENTMILTTRAFSHVQQSLHHSYQLYIFTSAYTHFSSGKYYFFMSGFFALPAALVAVDSVFRPRTSLVPPIPPTRRRLCSLAIATAGALLVLGAACLMHANVEKLFDHLVTRVDEAAPAAGVGAVLPLTRALLRRAADSPERALAAAAPSLVLALGTLAAAVTIVATTHAPGFDDAARPALMVAVSAAALAIMVCNWSFAFYHCTPLVVVTLLARRPFFALAGPPRAPVPRSFEKAAGTALLADGGRTRREGGRPAADSAERRRSGPGVAPEAAVAPPTCGTPELGTSHGDRQGARQGARLGARREAAASTAADGEICSFLPAIVEAGCEKSPFPPPRRKLYAATRWGILRATLLVAFAAAYVFIIFAPFRATLSLSNSLRLRLLHAIAAALRTLPRAHRSLRLPHLQWYIAYLRKLAAPEPAGTGFFTQSFVDTMIRLADALVGAKSSAAATVVLVLLPLWAGVLASLFSVSTLDRFENAAE